MYATASEVQVEVHPDRWRRGRYRVEVSAYLDRDADEVDAGLRRLGYEPIDIDQWGRSYHHRHEAQQTAELDDVEDRYASARLVLARGDLDPADIDYAEDELREMYDRVCRPLWRGLGEDASEAVPLAYRI